MISSRRPRSDGNPSSPRGRVRTTLLVSFATVVAVLSAVGAPVAASAAVPGSPAVTSSTQAMPANRCGPASTRVVGTGRPLVDRRNLQNAIDDAVAQGNGCVHLLGQFNVGVCFKCLKVTGPVTIAGQADPTGPNPRPLALTVVRATGGVGLLDVDESPSAANGVVEIRDVWWRGSDLSALSVDAFYRGELHFIRNRITDIRSRLGQRFASDLVGREHRRHRARSAPRDRRELHRHHHRRVRSDPSRRRQRHRVPRGPLRLGRHRPQHQHHQG